MERPETAGTTVWSYELSLLLTKCAAGKRGNRAAPAKIAVQSPTKGAKFVSCRTNEGATVSMLMKARAG